MERVVVAIDFTDASAGAAEWVARDFARGVELVLVHVIEAPPFPRFSPSAVQRPTRSSRVPASVPRRGFAH
jgi:hypothetical protein